jgi:CHAT domain-containing protein
MGTQALKSLVSRCQSPWILHIATHGYFLETRPETPPPQMMNFQRLHSAAQQNPLARSGLAFAGANTVLDGGNLPPEAEDGLLTAQGASGINLAATALVVASACQTALGDVQVGEGVLGLRRAFVLAGAQTLVMSLWSVPDVATAILMERLYHNLLNEKMGRAKALEQAQFYVRDLTIAQMRPQWLTPEAITSLTERSSGIGNHLRELSQKPENYRPYAHPKHWGAFICQGDVSPLL